MRVETERTEINPLPDFRELPAVEHWSATLITGIQNKSALQNALSESMEETGFSYSGYFTYPNDNSIAYYFSRYPRQKYGVATLEQCGEAFDELCTRSTAQNIGFRTRLSSEENPTSSFRVLLGLHSRYDRESGIHSPEEVKSYLSPEVSVVPAEIYVVRPEKIYEEPAVVVVGDSENLHKIYQLAEDLEQDRFTIEDLQRSVAYIVETPSCTTPDPG